MKKQTISPQAFLERARPTLGWMYHCALLISDSAEAAEDTLLKALCAVYRSGEYRDKRALRERLRKETLQRALLAQTDPSLRGDWRGVQGEAVMEDAVLSALFSRFSMEDREAQRCLLMYYGCGLSGHQCAQALEKDVAAAKALIAGFRSRVAGESAEAFERSMSRMCRSLLEEGGVAPDMGAVCRAFERDAIMAVRGKRSRHRFPSALLCALGVLLCMALFWLFAVLLEPSFGGEEAALLILGLFA